MMDIWQALVLGLLQGATEFIPVSSSGHLVLVPWVLGWPSPGLAFDTVVHWGTAVAVVVIFWRDLLALLRGWWGTVRDRSLADPMGRLAWLLVLATVPGVLLGVLFEELFEQLFGTPPAAAAFLLVTAGLLVWSERIGRRERGLGELGVWDALLIGVGQALAIAPGISRSGSTIAVGLFRGLRREAAARFSFLLSLPIILGAGAKQLLDLVATPGWTSSLSLLAVGFLAAALSGYLCIRYLLAYLRRGRLYPFAVYCALAGVAGLVLAAVRGW